MKKLDANKLLCAWFILLGGVSAPAAVQLPEGVKAKGFQFPVDENNVRKALFSGDEFQILPNGMASIKKFKMEFYGTNGQVELIGEAPNCYFNYKTLAPSSSGPLELKSADGLFFTEGVGFQWSQRDSTLLLSNQVHTLIRREQKKKANPIAAPSPGTPADRNRSSTNEVIELFSDRLRYSAPSRVAVYQGNVRALETRVSSGKGGTNEPPLALSCGLLTVRLPQAERRLQALIAEHDVLIEQGQNRLRGAKGIYRVEGTNEVLEMSGDPTWQSGDISGAGERLSLDRERNKLQATGQARLQLPWAGLNQGTGPLEKKEGARPDKIEIFCESYEIDPASLFCLGQVRLRAPTWALSCDRMEAELAASGNEISKLIAEEMVRMTTQEKEVNTEATGQRAIYSQAAGVERVELRGNPAWRRDRYSGKGDLLILTRQNNEPTFEVHGNAELQFPRSGLTQTAMLQNTNSPVATNSVVQIFCQEYEFSPGKGAFKDQVRVLDPDWTLTCDRMNLKLSEADQRLEWIAAEQRVLIDQLLATTNKTTHWKMSSDYLTVSFKGPTNRIDTIMAEQNVMIDQEPIRATSGRAVYRADTSLLELSVNPVLRTPEIEVSNSDLLIWDRQSGQLTAIGKYTATGTVEAIKAAEKAKREKHSPPSSDPTAPSFRPAARGVEP